MRPGKQLLDRLPAVDLNEKNLAMLWLGVCRINDSKLAGAKMWSAVVIGDRMQDAAGRHVIEHCEGS
jgi:hypothetical protein